MRSVDKEKGMAGEQNKDLLNTTREALVAIDMLEKSASFSDEALLDKVRRQILRMEDIRAIQLRYINKILRQLELCRSGKNIITIFLFMI